MSNVKQLTREEFGAMPKGESWNHIGELNEMIAELTMERDAVNGALSLMIDDRNDALLRVVELTKERDKLRGAFESKPHAACGEVVTVPEYHELKTAIQQHLEKVWIEVGSASNVIASSTAKVVDSLIQSRQGGR